MIDNAKKFRIVEWFGGIGAATMALIKEYGHNIECVDYVEIDKHAVDSYNAINGTSYIPIDINDVNINKYGKIDLLVAGIPCQPYSTGGKRKGFEDQRADLWQVAINNIARMVIKPKYILIENVKGLLNKDFKDDLDKVNNKFINLGYQWEQVVLNSKYFNVPQSRERVFILFTRNDLQKISLQSLLNFNKVNVKLRDVLDYSAPSFKVSINSNDRYQYFKNEMSQYNGKIVQIDMEKLNNQNPNEINKIALLGEFVSVENGGGAISGAHISTEKGFFGCLWSI